MEQLSQIFPHFLVSRFPIPKTNIRFIWRGGAQAALVGNAGSARTQQGPLVIQRSPLAAAPNSPQHFGNTYANQLYLPLALKSDTRDSGSAERSSEPGLTTEERGMCTYQKKQQRHTNPLSSVKLSEVSPESRCPFSLKVPIFPLSHHNPTCSQLFPTSAARRGQLSLG